MTLMPMAITSPDQLHRLGESLANEPRNKRYVENLTGTDRSVTAILLENQRMFLQNLDETTRALMIGHFDKFAMPLVRAVYPNLIANEIVSIQPMAGPVSLVFYLDFLFANTKGNIAAGSTIFDSRSGPVNTEFYSSDTVPMETPARTSGSTDTDAFIGSLAYKPIRPGTVTVTFTETVSGTVRTGTDDGNGNIIGTGITTSTINYTTGLLTLSATTNAVDDSTLVVSYRYDTEANDNIPMLDMMLTSSPVIAKSRKLRFRYSLEAAQNANALHGLDIQSELVGVTAEAIKREIDREVISDLWNYASAGHVSWDKTVPFGISYTEHKLSIVDAFVQGSNLVFGATKRGQTNWMVIGLSVADVVETLPTFTPLPGALGVQQNTGPVKIGTLNNRWTVYKDPDFPAAKWLMGWKGGGWLETGYVMAPYIPIYTTPQIILDDFIGRQGVATQYGKKPINSRFYCTGEILNA